MAWITLKKKKEVKDLVPKKKEPPTILKNPTPEMLISQAIDQQVPIEHMEKLMAMRRELKAEQAREAFFRDLAAFQAECPVIKKKKKVNNKDTYGKKGEVIPGTVRYHFAPLDNIVEQVKEYLQKFGFSYTIQTINEKDPDGQRSVCTVHHVEGHSRESEFWAPVDHDAYMSNQQKWASASTYGKRYAFCNAFGILTGDEDNDAQSCEDEKPHQEQNQKGNEDIEKVKNQILLQMKADVFTDEERKTKETFMKGIRSIQGLNGMLKGIQREQSDRVATLESEKEVQKKDYTVEPEGVQQELK